MTPDSKYHGQHPYGAQYIWDTLFMLEPLCLLPGQTEVVREVLRNFWEFQDAWDAIVPEHARGMIQHGFHPDAFLPTACKGNSCSPWLAWGVERIYNHTGDETMAHEALPHLERYHDWYWRERDLDGIGLIAPGAYGTDQVQAMRDDSGYDFAADMDALAYIQHPRFPERGAAYGNLYGVTNTAYVVHAERCLQRLAAKLGDHAMAARRDSHLQKAVAAARERMWNEETGMFHTLRRDGGKVPTLTIGAFMMLLAQVPTPAQAERILGNLRTPNWLTPLPMPTVGRGDPKWEPATIGMLPNPPVRLDHLGQAYNMWRGDVWPPCNYQVAMGAAAYGATDLAARICDATVMNAIQWDDVNERYCCDTGRPLGPSDYGMSACVLSMVYDGLPQRYGATNTFTTKPQRSGQRFS
jgi:putative isomerase